VYAEKKHDVYETPRGLSEGVGVGAERAQRKKKKRKKKERKKIYQA